MAIITIKGAVLDLDIAKYTSGQSNAVERSLQSRFEDLVSVKDYGAVGDGSTDDTAAVQDAITNLGYAYFPVGTFKLTTTTLDSPVIFQWGAALDVTAGQTVTIQGRIESPRQFIFQGSGDYALQQGSTSGEEVRQIHVSWFGAFPNPTAGGADQAPAINKALQAVGNVRESEVNFDIGNYQVDTPITVTRGAHILGRGTRRTVFKTSTNGFDIFTTSGDACRFSGFQFELDTITNRAVGAFIRIDHSGCDVYDVGFNTAVSCLVINGLNCRVDNIFAVYGENPGAGSSLVDVRRGGCRITNILSNTSTAFGPENMVDIGSNASGTISSVFVGQMDYASPARGILAAAVGGNLSRLIFDNIRYNGFAGTNPAEVIKITTSTTRGIDDIAISNVVASSFASNGIGIEQNSSGITQDIMINNCILSGSGSGFGIKFAQTAGALRQCSVGASCALEERANPVEITGTVEDIKVDPNSIPDRNLTTNFDFTINDDAFVLIELNRRVFAGTCFINAGFQIYGSFSIRAANAPGNIKISGTAEVAAAVGPLNGTTGTDGNLTVSTDDAQIYIENRTNSSQRVNFSLLTGIT